MSEGQHYIVTRARSKDGRKVGLTLGGGGPWYASAAKDVLKFYDADSAGRFADYAEENLERSVSGTEFVRECGVEKVRNAS